MTLDITGIDIGALVAALATTLIQQAGNLPTDTSGNITIGAEIERIL